MHRSDSETHIVQIVNQNVCDRTRHRESTNERFYAEFENKNIYTWCHTDISQPSYTTKQIYNYDLSCKGKSTVFLFTEDYLFYQTIKIENSEILQ